MAYVRSLNYSTYHDVTSNVSFVETLDSQSMCWLGIATVSGEVAASFEGRRGFVVLTDAEFAQILGYAVPAPPSGDPLEDEANKAKPAEPTSDPLANAPPPPPSAS